MTLDYRRISVGIHGWWGAGKSWLADSAPGPKLTLDAEGGSLDTPSPKFIWDPLEEDIPELGKGGTAVVDVTRWSQVDQVRKVLRSGEHPFHSVVVDSITEIQKQMKDKIRDGGDAKFGYDEWGSLLDNMELFVRELRDLSRSSSRNPVNVIIVAGTDDEIVPARPMFQGALRKSYPGFFDIIGHLTTRPNDDGGDDRLLQIQPTQLTIAKCRLHKVAVANPSGSIINPTIPDILRWANG